MIFSAPEEVSRVQSRNASESNVTTDETMVRKDSNISDNSVSQVRLGEASSKEPEEKTKSKMSTMDRLRLFTRRSNPLIRESPIDQGKTRKGPAAGTGHEGYGKHAHTSRRKGSASSSSAGSRSSSGTSNGKSQPELDEFYLQRLEPVRISGGAGDSRIPRNELQNTGGLCLSTGPDSQEPIRFSLPPASIHQVKGGVVQRNDVPPAANSAMVRPKLGHIKDQKKAITRKEVPQRHPENDNKSSHFQSSQSVASPVQTDISLEKRGKQSLEQQHPWKALERANFVRPSDDNKEHKRRSQIPEPPIFHHASQVPVAVAPVTGKRSTAHYAFVDTDSESLDEVFRRVKNSPPMRDDNKSRKSGQLSTENTHRDRPLSRRQPTATTTTRLEDQFPMPARWDPRYFSRRDSYTGTPLGNNAQQESNNSGTYRGRRLAPVGRIPPAISRRERQQQHRPMVPSFSRPFSIMSDNPSSPSTMSSNNQQRGRTNFQTRASRRVTPPMPSNISEFIAGSYAKDQFLAFSPRNGSDASSTSTGSQGRRSSLASITAILPEPGSPLTEDEVWGEYDDLVERLSQPSSSPTSTRRGTTTTSSRAAMKTDKPTTRQSLRKSDDPDVLISRFSASSSIPPPRPPPSSCYSSSSSSFSSSPRPCLLQRRSTERKATDNSRPSDDTYSHSRRSKSEAALRGLTTMTTAADNVSGQESCSDRTADYDDKDRHEPIDSAAQPDVPVNSNKELRNVDPRGQDAEGLDQTATAQQEQSNNNNTDESSEKAGKDKGNKGKGKGKGKAVKGSEKKSNNNNSSNTHARTNIRSDSIMTSRWLSFGRVLVSPAHGHIMSRPEGERLLVIDGLENDDWSIYCALNYPTAEVIRLSTSPSTSALDSSSKSSRRLPNHNIIHHKDLSKPFPFPRNYFSATILRFPGSSPETIQANMITECKRVLRSGGYMEMSILDLDMINMGMRTRKMIRAFKEKIILTDSNISLKPTSDSIQRLLGKYGFDNLQQCFFRIPVTGGNIDNTIARSSWDSTSSSSSLSPFSSLPLTHPATIPIPGLTTISKDPQKKDNTEKKKKKKTKKEKKTSTTTSNDSSSNFNSNSKSELLNLLSDPSPSPKNDEAIANVVAKVGRWWYTRCYEKPILLSNNDNNNGNDDKDKVGGDNSKVNTTAESIWSDKKLLRECQLEGTSFRLTIAYAQKPSQVPRRTASV